jgi:DNA (cytosine-5)-methyltransferase 1
MPIPVIDLFAGPGGLGEGFSALRREGQPVFKIKLSIEKDSHAHQTLELRAFFRQFPDGKAPEEYYDYLTGRITRETLFQKFPSETEKTTKEAWHAELGRPQYPKRVIDDRICAALDDPGPWVLIGGPPCQAYSLVGRSRIIGEEDGLAKYEKDARHNLYRRYLRILAVHRPPVFIMENVKGLLSATRRKQRIFERILHDLKNPPRAVPEAEDVRASHELSYRLFPLVSRRQGDLLEEFAPEDFVVRTEDYGIPQARHRIIVLGLRSDFFHRISPRALRTESPVFIEQAIADLPPLRSGISKEIDSAEEWYEVLRSTESMTWVKNGSMDARLRRELRDTVQSLKSGLTRGAEFLAGTPSPGFAKEWFCDTRLKGFCNHSTRSHIREDLHRYLFVSAFARVNGRSPLLNDLPARLLPDHKNVAEALEETKFNDRFRVQLKGRPSTTVTSHISKDGHYFIHYDPTQCRSLTVREAARLQTFPDNYFFEGPRTQQYQQVGNAVPPLLAKQIAGIVHDLLH